VASKKGNSIREELKIIEVPASTVAAKWEIFGWYIKQGLSEVNYQHDFSMGNLLTAILEERLTVYTFFLRGQMIGIMTAMVGGDTVTGGCDFLIYSLVGLRNASPTVMKRGLEMVVEIAKKMECRRIVTFTKSDGIVKLLGHFGFGESYTMIKEL